MARESVERAREGLRVLETAAALDRVLAERIAADPELTREEIMCAVLRCAGGVADQIRRATW